MTTLSFEQIQSEPFDVLVVGGGLAGLSAAVRALESGVSVLVIDKQSGSLALNNSRVASGVFHITFEPPNLAPDLLYERIMETTAGTARPELARILAESSLPAMLWLEQKWETFGRWRGEDGLWLAEPNGLGRKGLPWEGYGMDRLLRALHEDFCLSGGRYLPGTTASELMMTDERISGVVVSAPHGENYSIEANAVILADGGFQANRSMVGEYISPAPDQVKVRATGIGNGDGIRMALEVGAKCISMHYFYGHTLHRESMERDDLWPYPAVDVLMAAGIVIDSGGQRFMDEGCGGVCMTNTLARRKSPQDAFVVFDQSIWNGPAREGIFPANPTLMDSGATIWHSDEIPDLAALAGIDQQRLAVTVEEYNTAVKSGKSFLLPVPRTPEPIRPFPIENPPYYAIPIVPGITLTMGGLLISDRAEVLGTEEVPIPGLYAAGANIGGLDGGPRVGYVGGLAEAAVFGWIAGREAAAHVG